MGLMGRVIAGGFASLLGLVGLFFAANAIDGGIYYSGLLIFVTMLVYVFYLVRRQIDESEAAHRERAESVGDASAPRRS